MGNGKRRNTTYTERPAWHDDDTELHPSIARERSTCLLDGVNDAGKTSENARGSSLFHVKRTIKRPASLPAPRLGRRHASPGAQENGTGSGATAWDARHQTTRDAPPASIPTAGTTRRDGKRTRKREGSPQERHGVRPKGDAGTPADDENVGETARFATRRAGRGTRRDDTWHETQAESTGAGGNRRADGRGERAGTRRLSRKNR